MKKLLALVLALMLAGCAAPDAPEPKEAVPAPPETETGAVTETPHPWGIALSVKDVTTTGLTLVCTQSGGVDVTELLTGQYFVLEQRHSDHWEECEVLLQNYAFTQEGWIIPLNDSVEWDVVWEWLYGQLSAGKYRIGKEIMNFRGTGDYDQEMYYAEFSIHAEFTIG